MNKQVKKDKAQYIGPNKVLGITKLENKTPEGNEIIEVVYADNSAGLKQAMTLIEFNGLVTDEPIDFTELRNRHYSIVVPLLLSILGEYNIKKMDVEGLVQNLIHSLGDHFDRAANYLWTENDNLFVPGTDHLSHRSLIDCHRVFDRIKKTNEPEIEGEKN